MRALRRLLCLAVLLCTAGASADPRTPEEARVALERQRTRYADALDRASWQRDDPAVRVVVEEVTREALGVLDEVPALESEARSLVREAGGSALGPWLHQHGSVGDTLLGAWLRGHDDPTLLSSLAPHDAWSRLPIAEEVVFERPALAAELVLDGVRTWNPRLGEFCAVANALPDARRRELATQAWQASHFEVFAECLALVASHPTLRRDLAQRALAELTRAEAPSAFAGGFPFHGPVSDSNAWAVAAAALTLPGVPAALAQRLRGALTRRVNGVSWADAAPLLSPVAPWLRADHPMVASLLRDVERHSSTSPGAFLRCLPVPTRARASAHLEEFLASIERPGWVSRASGELVREVSLAAPRDAAASQEVVRALSVLYQRQRAYAGNVAPRLIDAWIEALERSSRCPDDACLTRLVRSATDETAARAAWLLGPRALASLSPDDARALVRRVVIDRPVSTPGPSGSRLVNRSALAMVVYGTLESCPSELRGLASLDAFRASDEDPIVSWRRAFAARCRDEPRARSAR